MSLGEANVPIRATLDKLDGDLNKARGKIEGALAGITKSMQSLGKIALGGAIAGVAAIGTGIVAVAKKAIPAASDLNEALNASSVVFGEAAGKIQEYGEIASDTAGLSAREFNQMGAQMGAMLKNMGLSQDSAADSTIELTQRAADMASIFNTDVSEALFAIQSGLQGQSEPLRRFGVDVSDAAIRAHALEIGLGDITRQTDAASYAQAQMSLILAQTDDIAGDFVNTSGELANATRVNQARWENFMAQMGQSFLPVMQTVQGVLMDLGERVFPVVLAVMEPVGQAVERFVNALLSGVNPLDAVSLLIAELGRAFGVSEEAVDGVRQALSSTVETVTAFIDRARGILAPVMEVIGGFVSWKDVLLVLGIAIAAFVAPVVIAGAKIALVFAAVTAAVALLRNAWENNWGGIQEKTQAVIEFIQNLVTTVMTGLQAFWAANGDAILAKAQEIWDSIKNFIDATITLISNIIETVAGGIQAFWAAHGEAVLTLTQGIWDAIMIYINAALDQISTLFDTFAALFRGDWEAFGEGIKELWTNAWDAIVAIVGTIWAAISPLLASMWASLSGWFTSKVGEMAAIGSNLITALADAISTRANNYLRRVAQGVANLLPGWVKEILGITSPSLVFMEIGKNIAEGLAQGILDNIPTVREAVDALLEATSNVGSIAGTIGNIYKARVVDPLQSQLEGQTQGLESFAEGINEALSEMFSDEDIDILAMSQEERMEALFRAQQSGNHQLAADITRLNQLEERRNRTAEEFREHQERILQLEQQQQDLQLLQAQQDLLNLIRDNNLSASILSGLELGLDADLADILDAMSMAMQELLQQTETELGIASPSKKFMEIGKQITAGLAQGMARTQDMVTRGMGAMMQPPSFAMAAAGVGMGQLVINVDARGTEDPAAMRRAVRRGVQEGLDSAGKDADVYTRIG